MSFRFILKTIIIFIGLIFCLPVVALAAEVRINPAVTTVAVDSQVAVSVDIDNVENLFAVSFDLFFDPAILEFISAEEGGFFNESGAITTFLVDNSQPGDLLVYYERTDGVPSEVSLAAGSSELIFGNNFLYNETPADWFGGTITVETSQPAPDTTSPVTPSDLTAIAVSASQIDLSWSIPEDPETAGQITSGLAGYRVYRDGTEIATTTDLFYSDIGLTASTTYSYTITIFAFDSAENESDQSEPVSVATLAEIIPATVSILPASTTVVVGLQVTVSIDIDNVEDLFAVAFDLVFDSDILSFVSAQKGTFLEQDGFATDLSASFLRDPQENIIDPGRLIVGYSRLAGQGGSIGASGSGNLMTLTFEAVATGTSSLAFQKTHFFNSSLDEILTNWNNGLVEAGTPSECASFVYTGWSSCQANNTQARTVVSSLPCGCFGGSPVLSQSCVYIPPSAVYPMGDTINILPPELSVSNVSVKNTETTENNIIIYWTTSYPASSQVVYSKDGESHALDVDDEKFGYARATPEFDTPPNVNGTTTHSVIIEDLVPGATYYFRTVSRGSLAMSQEYSFVALLKTSNIETEIKGEVIEMVALNESQISEQKEMPQDEGQTKVGFTETIKENYFEKRGEQPSEAELPGNNSISENALGAVGSPNNLMATAGLFSGKINQSVLLIFSAVGILLLILTILVLFSKKCKNIISNLFYNIKK
ncbi:MAG: hypothetical protein UV36_C0006G0002 [Parcubacteria group bacterium GW2011_GWC2_42_6]|nr:MAG: hypothetical protein UV36_C0006G0002 [Parcubacteria group bacterium GW2011_GWC2_42_6]